MCGLLKRDILPDVDVGYAYLPDSGARVMRSRPRPRRSGTALANFGLTRIIGVVSEGNTGSIRVLEKLGMRFERLYPHASRRAGGAALCAARSSTSAARDRVADHLADLRAGVDVQFHRPLEAQLAVDNAGAADVNLDRFAACPSPNSSRWIFFTWMPPCTCAPSSRSMSPLLRGELAHDFGAFNLDFARDRRHVAADARALGEPNAAVHGRCFALDRAAPSPTSQRAIDGAGRTRRARSLSIRTSPLTVLRRVRQPRRVSTRTSPFTVLSVS